MTTTFNLELNAKPKADGTHGILIRITQNRRHKRISSGIFIKKPDFNKKAKYGKWIRSSNPAHEKINKTILDKIKKANESLAEIEKERRNPSLSVIKTQLKGYSKNFFEFADQKIIMLEESGKIGTYKKYKSVIDKLKKYVGSTDLFFDDLTVTFMVNYQHHLVKIGNKKNTIHSNLKTVKRLIKQAIEEGIFSQEKNPFFVFKLRTEAGSKERLSGEEIKKIASLKLDKGSLLSHCRNAFMFSFYGAGIRASDLLEMKWKNIVNERLEYQMNKTGRLISLKLFKGALDILKEYRQTISKGEDYIFPFLDAQVMKSGNEWKIFNEISSKNALINKYLKMIAEKANIEKNISLHVSRHSFASIAKGKNIELQKISELLVHGNKQITEDYLRPFASSELDETMEAILMN